MSELLAVVTGAGLAGCGFAGAGLGGAATGFGIAATFFGGGAFGCAVLTGADFGSGPTIDAALSPGTGPKFSISGCGSDDFCGCGATAAVRVFGFTAAFATL